MSVDTRVLTGYDKRVKKYSLIYYLPLLCNANSRPILRHGKGVKINMTIRDGHKNKFWNGGKRK